MKYKYLDLFAGAGGLSEGFMRANYTPIAHVEMDKAACYTLKTRLAYKWLKENNKGHIYDSYLAGNISRKEFYEYVPSKLLNTVLDYEISDKNIEHIFEHIDKILKNKDIDIIIGGPPCQAYSLAGRSRDINNMVGDNRNYLYKLYAKFLKKYSPRYFVFENVLGLLSAMDKDKNRFLPKMLDLFSECGYSVEYKVLNASDYGVMQNRRRLILIGKYGNHKDFYPEIPKISNNFMVEEIFKDLPKIKAGEGDIFPIKTLDYSGEYLYNSKIKFKNLQKVTLHCARPNNCRDLMIYEEVIKAWNKEKKRLNYNDLPKELCSHSNTASFLDRFKVVAGNLPYSQTVVAHIAKDGHYYIHPDINQNRSLTPREAARLQTFPDDYYFESISGISSRTTAFKQIGNAVPVLLAEKIANALLEVW